jgi:hypothetical protein
MLPLDRFPGLLDMKPFNFVMDTAHFNSQQRIVEIDSLSQLPYWVDDSVWAEWYYKERRRRGGSQAAEDTRMNEDGA